jgi:hypothetical protein
MILITNIRLGSKSLLLTCAFLYVATKRVDYSLKVKNSNVSVHSIIFRSFQLILSANLCVGLLLSVYSVSVCASTFLSVLLFICVTACLFNSPWICFYVRPSVCLSVCFCGSIHPTVCSPACLFVYLLSFCPLYLCLSLSITHSLTQPTHCLQIPLSSNIDDAEFESSILKLRL